jgi:uncharacterized protein
MVAPTPEDAVRMEVKGLLVDPTSNLPIVLLRDRESDLFLPIWIGVFEANAIAIHIEGIDTPRPMTHDLLNTLVSDLDATVEHVVITDLRESTFYAEIHLTVRKRQLTIDSRPSDAVALALRAQAPILVLRSVLEKAQAIDLTERLSKDERLKQWLEETDPEDLGKYEM